MAHEKKRYTFFKFCFLNQGRRCCEKKDLSSFLSTQWSFKYELKMSACKYWNKLDSNKLTLEINLNLNRLAQLPKFFLICCLYPAPIFTLWLPVRPKDSVRFTLQHKCTTEWGRRVSRVLILTTPVSIARPFPRYSRPRVLSIPRLLPSWCLSVSCGNRVRKHVKIIGIFGPLEAVLSIFHLRMFFQFFKNYAKMSFKCPIFM